MHIVGDVFEILHMGPGGGERSGTVNQKEDGEERNPRENTRRKKKIII